MSPAAAAGRLIILAGPSCAGKSPLAKALRRFHPDLAAGLRPVVLYNSRAPRPGEEDGVDYHFRAREDIRALDGDDRYLVLEVRADLQALDLEELRDGLRKGDLFFEGNPMVGAALVTAPALQDVPKVSAFMAPLGQDELTELADPEKHVDLPALVADVMRRKLLRRTVRQKGILARPDLEDIETRCTSAWSELQQAHLFDHVIVNHDGEDSDHWDAFYYPLGDARRSLRAFAALLRGATSPDLETWPEGFPAG